MRAVRELAGYLIGLLMFVILIPLLICLQSWKAAAIFAIYFAVMMVQVNREEQRLEMDFGEAYKDYCKKTKKLIPCIW